VCSRHAPPYHRCTSYVHVTQPKSVNPTCAQQCFSSAPDVSCPPHSLHHARHVFRGRKMRSPQAWRSAQQPRPPSLRPRSGDITPTLLEGKRQVERFHQETNAQQL
jgi:hypothetical protein